MNGCIGNKYTIIFCFVAAPNLIFTNIIGKVFLKNWSMKRTNLLNIQAGCLFQQSGCLRTIFTYNIKVISSCFTSPVFISIQRTKLTKSIGREQNFFRGFIRNHNLRPVNHRCHHKRKCVCTKRQGISLSNNHFFVCYIHLKELWQHRKYFRIADKLHLRIFFSNCLNASAVVRLQMRNHKIIRCFSIKFSL